MRFLSACLPLALSLLGLAQATEMPPGYDRWSLGNIDSVTLLDEDKKYHLVEVIRFHPWMKAATIYFVDEDIQPTRGSRLGLAESYNDLAKERERDPNDIDWIITEVTEDWETDDLIRDIRESRGVGPTDEVVVVPGDPDWDGIFSTKYHKYASLVNHKEIDRVLIRTVQRVTSGGYRNSECFYFYFPTRETAGGEQDEGLMTWEEVWEEEWTATQESEEVKAWVENQMSAEENDAALEGMLAEEETEEASSLALMYRKIAELTGDGY
ncbi:hypothetical protein CFO_g5249 [Ceratocystis platani]|uniref:Uncharacterized protein n=1 Tax=Ceratocystis fimbriata f. sp. platani TaxID=88771 RepID=A0A0F8BJF3_CERFI|nr:hypothetical protein CFO_g5249 [Ceratocystis platani]